MSLPKGSLVITNGCGKVTTLQPEQNDMLLIVDDSADKKIKFERIEKLLKNQTVKSTTIVQKKFDSNYEKAAAFTFPGKSSAIVKKISLLSYMHPSGNSYDVRLYDISNNKIICTKNFSNKSCQINVLDNLQNLPNNESIVEVQCKFNGNGNNKYIYIDEITLFYDLV